MLRHIWVRYRHRWGGYCVVAIILITLMWIYKQRQSETPDESQLEDDSVMAYRLNRYKRHQKRKIPISPGEGGTAVVLNSQEQQEADKLFKKEAFNIIASDKIALDRSLRDTRDYAYVAINIPYNLCTSLLFFIVTVAHLNY